MSTDIPTVDITEDLNSLYEAHGKALFQLIDDTTVAMQGDEEERFFVDDFPIRYRLTGADQGTQETLHKDLWDYFLSVATYGGDGHIAKRYVGLNCELDHDDEGEVIEKLQGIEYAHSDLSELILILRGDFKI